MDFARNIPADLSDPWYHFIQPLHRFDALWYEEIAKTNYKDSPLTTAFFPLYPWIVNGVGNFFGIPYVLSAFFLNTLFTFLVFFLLYYLTALEYTKKIAIRTTLIYAFFPASFFLLVPYAEPLLFLFILLSFIFAKYNKVILSVICCILAAITKPYGAIVLIPIGLIMLSCNKSFKKRIMIFFLLLLIPLSFLTINKYQESMVNSVSSSLNAQSLWGATIPMPWEPIFSEVKLLLRNPLDLPNSLNLITVISSVLFLIVSWRKISWSNWLFTFVLFITSYFLTVKQSILYSMSRHALIFFPLFMYLGGLKVNKLVEVVYLGTSVLIMIMFFIWYTFGFFVG